MYRQKLAVFMTNLGHFLILRHEILLKQPRVDQHPVNVVGTPDNIRWGLGGYLIHGLTTLGDGLVKVFHQVRIFSVVDEKPSPLATYPVNHQHLHRLVGMNINNDAFISQPVFGLFNGEVIRDIFGVFHDEF